MGYLAIWAFLLSIVAIFLSIFSMVDKKNDREIISPFHDFDEKSKEGHVALRSIEALAEKLGYELRQYNNLNQTGVLGAGVLEQNDQKQQENLQMLINHLGLEIFEGKELRKKKTK